MPIMSTDGFINADERNILSDQQRRELLERERNKWSGFAPTQNLPNPRNSPIFCINCLAYEVAVENQVCTRCANVIKSCNEGLSWKSPAVVVFALFTLLVVVYIALKPWLK